MSDTLVEAEELPMSARPLRPATTSNPIPSLVQLAALAVGSFGAACKQPTAAPDASPAPPPGPSNTPGDQAFVGAGSGAGAVDAAAPTNTGEPTDAGHDDAALAQRKEQQQLQQLLGTLHPTGVAYMPPPGGMAISRPMIDPLDQLGGGPPSAGNGPQFDIGIAQKKLAAAAASAGSCASDAGPHGHGHVMVTFDPSGKAVRVVVEPPFEGTGVGSCIEGHFRSVRLPPFSDPSRTVAKGFDMK
jgi:hypothetical protein